MDFWFLDDNWAQKQPASTPTLSSNPQTPIVSVKPCSIEDMWTKLSTCNSSDCNDIKQRLEWYKNLKDFKDSHKKQLESLLWKYNSLSWDPAKENFLIARLLLDLQWIEKQFQEDEKKIQADSQKWREFIFPTKYLDENEVLPNGVNNILVSLFWVERYNNIRWKMEVAENITDTKDLLERIKSIKISSAKIEKADWDNFFIDLRTEIDKNELPEFDKAVEEFKKCQDWKLYKDKTLWTWWLDIQQIWSDLDKEAKIIEAKNYQPWEKIELDIWNWSKVQFDTKESALRSIYKAKLIYDELSKMDSFKWMTFSFWFSSIKWIWELWLSAIWNLIVFVLVISPYTIIIWPAESVLRNIGDLWRTRLWDKGPIKWLRWKAESLENTDKSWKEWWKIKKLGRLVSTWPLSDFANIVSWLWDRYDRNEVKDNIWRNNFSIEDWLFSDPTKDIDITKEMNERVRLVSFFREKWKDNPENLAKLDRLIETSWIKEYITKIKYKNPADLISMWWQIFSPSKTFYLNLFEIDNWQTILWEKWWKPRFKWSYLNQPLHIIDPFFINYKKNVIEVINKDIKSIIESLKILYQVTEKDDWKIEIWEKTDFYKNLESSIDLNSEITLVEQKNRKTLFEQYIKDLRSWKLAWIKSNQFKVDLVLISMWKNTGGILTDKEIEVRLKLWEDMRWLKYNIEWIVWLDSNWHLNKWPEAKRKFIDTYSKEIAISNMLDNTLTIDSIKLELSKLFNDLVWNNVWWKKIEFMEWQVNFILKEIFAWKKYDVVKWLEIGEIDTVYDTHWNSDDIGRTLRDNLLTKMETELWAIEQIKPIQNTKSLLTKILTLLNDVNSNIILNPNIDINNELKKIIDSELPWSNNNRLFKMLESVINPTIWPRLMSIDKIESEINLILEGETINSKSNKIKEYNKRFEINWELQAYLKTLWGKYSTILSKLDKINSTLSLDLKTFVEFDDSGAFKWKALELIEKAKLVSPWSSDVIEALKTKIGFENNKITLVQFENILKGIVIWIDKNWNKEKLSIQDIQSLKFEDYDKETKLHQDATKIKLSDIITSPITIQWHGLDSTAEHTIRYEKDKWLEELINEWNSYVEKNKVLESQIQQLEQIRNLEIKVNEYDGIKRTLDTDIKLLIKQIEQNIEDKWLLTNSKKDQIKKDRLNNEINLLTAKKERMRDELKDIETNKIALEKEIREKESKLPRWAKLVELTEIQTELNKSFAETVKESPIYEKSKILKWKPYSIDLFKEFLKEVKSWKLIR